MLGLPIRKGMQGSVKNDLLSSDDPITAENYRQTSEKQLLNEEMAF